MKMRSQILFLLLTWFLPTKSYSPINLLNLQTDEAKKNPVETYMSEIEKSLSEDLLEVGNILNDELKHNDKTDGVKGGNYLVNSRDHRLGGTLKEISSLPYPGQSNDVNNWNQVSDVLDSNDIPYIGQNNRQLADMRGLKSSIIQGIHGEIEEFITNIIEHDALAWLDDDFSVDKPIKNDEPIENTKEPDADPGIFIPPHKVTDNVNKSPIASITTTKDKLVISNDSNTNNASFKVINTPDVSQGELPKKPMMVLSRDNFHIGKLQDAMRFSNGKNTNTEKNNETILNIITKNVNPIVGENKTNKISLKEKTVTENVQDTQSIKPKMILSRDNFRVGKLNDNDISHDTIYNPSVISTNMVSNVTISKFELSELISSKDRIKNEDNNNAKSTKFKDTDAVTVKFLLLPTNVVFNTTDIDTARINVTQSSMTTVDRKNNINLTTFDHIHGTSKIKPIIRDTLGELGGKSKVSNMKIDNNMTLSSDTSLHSKVSLITENEKGANTDGTLNTDFANVKYIPLAKKVGSNVSFNTPNTDSTESNVTMADMEYNTNDSSTETATFNHTNLSFRLITENYQKGETKHEDYTAKEINIDSTATITVNLLLLDKKVVSAFNTITKSEKIGSNVTISNNNNINDSLKETTTFDYTQDNPKSVDYLEGNKLSERSRISNITRDNNSISSETNSKGGISTVIVENHQNGKIKYEANNTSTSMNDNIVIPKESSTTNVSFKEVTEEGKTELTHDTSNTIVNFSKLSERTISYPRKAITNTVFDFSKDNISDPFTTNEVSSFVTAKSSTANISVPSELETSEQKKEKFSYVSFRFRADDFNGYDFHKVIPLINASKKLIVESIPMAPIESVTNHEKEEVTNNTLLVNNSSVS